MPYVEVEPGVKVHYQDWGQGLPAVFIHGWPYSAEMYEYQYQALVPQGVRAIGLDLRGFGRSDQPWMDYSFDVFADDVHRVLDTLDVRDVTLIGFSMGGAVALRYMGKYAGNRVARLALLGAATPCLTVKPDFPQGLDGAVYDGFITACLTDRARLNDDFGALTFNQPIGEALARWFMSMGMQASPQATLRCVELLRDGDLREDARSVRVPTLIAHGVHDQVAPIGITAEVNHALIGGSRLVRFEESGHGMFLDERERLNAELLAFIRGGATRPRVHTHTSGEAGLFVNSYLVEGERGVVVVDAPFTVSESQAMRAKLVDIGKPLLAVLLTHAHPDHANGITILRAGAEVPVLATAGVEATLREIDSGKRAYWTPFYGDEYPPVTTFPNRLVQDGEVVTFDDLTFTVHDMGAGENAFETMFGLPGNATFIGDVAYHRVHAWLAEGRLEAWLTQLDRARAVLWGQGMLYPGHGTPGGPELLDEQRAYLEHYRETVRELADGRDALDEAAGQELTRRMMAFWPEAPLASWIAPGGSPVAAELARASTRMT